MRPLIVTPAVHENAKRVMSYSEAHRYNLHDIFSMMGKRRPPPGDDPGHVCIIPIGFRCVFSIEEQPFGWVRHVSVSILEEGRMPSPDAMWVIAEIFGFGKESWNTSALHQEECNHKRIAVHMMQPLDGVWPSPS